MLRAKDLKEGDLVEDHATGGTYYLLSNVSDTYYELLTMTWLVLCSSRGEGYVKVQSVARTTIFDRHITLVGSFPAGSLPAEAVAG